MSNFPSTTPADVVEIRAYIRYWLIIDTTIISDDVIDIIIDNNITKFGDESICKITYYSTVDVLNWLIRKQAVDEGSSGTSGSVTKRREKNNRREIEVTYSDVSTSGLTGWSSILQGLLDNPSSIGCYPFSDVEDKDLVGKVIIGGSDVNGYEAGFRSRDTFECAIINDHYKRKRY